MASETQEQSAAFHVQVDGISSEEGLFAGSVIGSRGTKPELAFKLLKPLDVKPQDPLPEGPVGILHGILDNGLSYYVKRNAKPRARAALALVVRVGSVLEEEEERGVAHIVEHLAFNATKHYTNHDIVKFLESIGAEFGACQNASTSADETVYELLVPIDKPEILSQAISVLAEFSTEIRASEEDLAKERGAVLEEYRGGRNALGRMQEAHWCLLMKGSKYEERQPIGLEKVIKSVTAKCVQEFYHQWYHPRHMALIAIGDFVDAEAVVELIKLHFRQKPESPPLPIPSFPMSSHGEPRFSCSSEAEAGGSAVMMSFKVPVRQIVTVEDCRSMLAEAMFHNALNQYQKNRTPHFFLVVQQLKTWSVL